MKNIKIVIALVAIVGIGVLIYFGNGENDKGVLGINGKAYVAVEGSGEIAVIDTVTKQVLKRIDLSEDKNGMTVGYMPHNVQVAPDNKSVWVTANAMDEEIRMSFRIIQIARADTGHGDEGVIAEKSNDEVIVIDPFSDAIVKRIEIGQDLHLSHVALTPDSAYAVVASQEKGIMYKINTASFEVEKEVATKKGGGPHGLRISPDGKTAYIAMLGGKSLGVLDIASFSLKDILLKGAAVQTGVTPDGKYALASVYDAKSLAVYDIASAKLSYIDLPKEAKGPVQIYPTPDSRFVFVADQGFYFDQPVGDTVYKIDLQEMKLAQAIKGGSAPHGVVVSKDGRFAYITNLQSDDVSVIDTEAGKEITKIKVGKMPNGISLWYGDSSISGKGNYSELVSVEKSFDFGTVSMVKGKVSHSFKIKNMGSTQIKIVKVYTSCMCTEATIVNGISRKGPFGMPGHGGLSSIGETVKAGQEISIEVEVDPAAHGPQGTGPAKKVVYIETDSAITPTLKLELDINVTP
ncbi:MAG: beta-propeller fold lactonase family protein [Patescibacteria group bacterium]